MPGERRGLRAEDAGSRLLVIGRPGFARPSAVSRLPACNVMYGPIVTLGECYRLKLLTVNPIDVVGPVGNFYGRGLQLGVRIPRTLKFIGGQASVNLCKLCKLFLTQKSDFA